MTAAKRKHPRMNRLAPPFIRHARGSLHHKTIHNNFNKNSIRYFISTPKSAAKKISTSFIDNEFLNHDVDSHYHDTTSTSSSASQDRYNNINPYTRKIISECYTPTLDQVEYAIQSAKTAFNNSSSGDLARRGQILNRTADLMEQKYANELTLLECLDTGIPISQTKYHISAAVDCLRHFAGAAACSHTRMGVAVDTPMAGGGADSFCYTRREPLGVVAGIGAWNYPLLLMVWKLAPAIACGNSFVFKPSECTPLTALKCAEIMKEAGLPAGVLNVLLGDKIIGQALSRDATDIRKISFTGSTAAGIDIYREAAPTLKRVTMELGGKSPLLVLADADIDTAVAAAITGNFMNNGECCTNCTRVFVHSSIKNAFIDKLINQASDLVVGDPLDERTYIGPLIAPPSDVDGHLNKVAGFINRAKADPHCRLLLGGSVKDDYCVEPTIFFCDRDDVEVASDEIFGPVMSILSFDDIDDAIFRANSSEYGLAAGIITSNVARAQHVAKRLDAGYVWVNNYNLSPVEVPFGGRKMSGFGKELGLNPIDDYTQIKTVYIEAGNVDAS